MPLAPVQVASIATLWHRTMRSNRMELSPARSSSSNECHHVPLPSYRKVVEVYRDSITLGLTATPRVAVTAWRAGWQLRQVAVRRPDARSRAHR
jgi:superfamily II DNA or RNA helicase